MDIIPICAISEAGSTSGKATYMQSSLSLRSVSSCNALNVAKYICLVDANITVNCLHGCSCMEVTLPKKVRQENEITRTTDVCRDLASSGAKWIYISEIFLFSIFLLKSERLKLLTFLGVSCSLINKLMHILNGNLATIIPVEKFCDNRGRPYNDAIWPINLEYRMPGNLHYSQNGIHISQGNPLPDRIANVPIIPVNVLGGHNEGILGYMNANQVVHVGNRLINYNPMSFYKYKRILKCSNEAAFDFFHDVNVFNNRMKDFSGHIPRGDLNFRTYTSMFDDDSAMSFSILPLVYRLGQLQAIFDIGRCARIIDDETLRMMLFGQEVDNQMNLVNSNHGNIGFVLDANCVEVLTKEQYINRPHMKDEFVLSCGSANISAQALNILAACAVHTDMDAENLGATRCIIISPGFAENNIRYADQQITVANNRWIGLEQAIEAISLAVRPEDRCYIEYGLLLGYFSFVNYGTSGQYCKSVIHGIESVDVRRNYGFIILGGYNGMYNKPVCFYSQYTPIDKIATAGLYHFLYSQALACSLSLANTNRRYVMFGDVPQHVNYQQQANRNAARLDVDGYWQQFAADHGMDIVMGYFDDSFRNYLNICGKDANVLLGLKCNLMALFDERIVDPLANKLCEMWEHTKRRIHAYTNGKFVDRLGCIKRYYCDTIGFIYRDDPIIKYGESFDYQFDVRKGDVKRVSEFIVGNVAKNIFEVSNDVDGSEAIWRSYRNIVKMIRQPDQNGAYTFTNAIIHVYANLPLMNSTFDMSGIRFYWNNYVTNALPVSGTYDFNHFYNDRYAYQAFMCGFEVFPRPLQLPNVKSGDRFWLYFVNMPIVINHMGRALKGEIYYEGHANANEILLSCFGRACKNRLTLLSKEGLPILKQSEEELKEDEEEVKPNIQMDLEREQKARQELEQKLSILENKYQNTKKKKKELKQQLNNSQMEIAEPNLLNQQ